MLNEETILGYIKELDKRNYPYDIASLHYCIGSDNGPPDPRLADMVRSWNDKYSSPRLKIATVSECFSVFEKRYGHTLPQVRGDFTGYWEDGAASSARETAMNRRSAEKLVQARILWSMVRPQQYPFQKFESAWKNVLLFSEHTWGAWNSVSDPQSEFAKEQWQVKKRFALNAAVAGDRLLDQLLNPIDDRGEPRAIDVYNTLSWPRTDLIILKAKLSQKWAGIADGNGLAIPSQRLSTGQLVFLAEDLPPLGVKRFFFSKNHYSGKSQLRIKGYTISNQYLSLQLDEKTGDIKRLQVKEKGFELVDQQQSFGLNRYLYVPGRDPKVVKTLARSRIKVKENGPLLVSLLVETTPPGGSVWKCEISLVDGLNRIDIKNTLDKPGNYNPEAVHIAFPFNVPQGQIRINTAWGYYRPDTDQIPGACKNYFTLQRWLDISNREFGLTWASLDAPLFEIGGLTVDPIETGWLTTVKPGTHIYSYVMNNYWETNYRAAQEGTVTFQYTIKPHHGFDPIKAEKFGVERSQPPLVSVVDGEAVPKSTLFTILNPGVILTSISPVTGKRGLEVRLYNAGKESEILKIKWGSFRPMKVYQFDHFGRKQETGERAIKIYPLSFITLSLEN